MSSIYALRNTVKLSTLDIEQLPNHKVKSNNEWSSACPQCGGEDRFLFWPNEGNFWCRQCDLFGWIDQQAQSGLTEDQRADIERRKREARAAEIEREKTALQRLRTRRPDVLYHSQLNGKAEEVSLCYGLDQDTIDRFNIGYCNACPTSPYSPSFTIPYYWQEKLINLRHRLLNPNGSGKYRPECAGLPTAIFNADEIKKSSRLILVEGEFKAMFLVQNGLPAIGIPGATNFKEKWLGLFKGKTVYVALDPGVEAAALKICKMLNRAGVKVYLVSLPTKPDDFFYLYEGSLDQFNTYLETARLI